MIEQYGCSPTTTTTSKRKFIAMQKNKFKELSSSSNEDKDGIDIEQQMGTLISMETAEGSLGEDWRTGNRRGTRARTVLWVGSLGHCH